jgi:hypothetical protein
MPTLFQRVLSFIEAPEAHDFLSLALEVFRYQAAHVPVYRRYLASLKIDPQAVSSLEEIPPVSTSAYKYARVENELHPESPASRVFRTSGTTRGKEECGRHHVPAPEIYRASAINHLRRMMFPDGKRLSMLALHPVAERMPDSSLAQMISWCIEEFGDGTELCVATRESVDTASAIDFLQAAQQSNRPVCILGTTASCAALFAAIRERASPVSLPVGSRLMDTGGPKGQSDPLPPDQVIAQASRLLGIDPALVINEYGMTEMCSQLYDATSFNSSAAATRGMRVKLAPPWLKPAAIDPITLTPTTNEEPGVLAFFDLANVGSISALMTDDIGTVEGDMVVVLGRASGADIRGCALAVSQFMQRTESSPLSSATRVPHGARCDQGQTIAIESPCESDGLTAADIDDAARQLTVRLASPSTSNNPFRLTAMLRELTEVITNRSWGWREAIRRIAASSGCTESLLHLSLRALMKPLADASQFAGKIKQRHAVFGFIMPGNVPGAGIHELLAVLLAGAAAIVKSSASEPVFFAQLAGTIRELDGRFGTDLGARLQVFNWPRERTDLTAALVKNCTYVVVLGDDVTIAQLEQLARSGQLIGFGSRVSVAVVLTGALEGRGMGSSADRLALDCAMFDQRGCLSPHHVFVEGRAREFACELAAAFSRMAPLLVRDRGLRGLDLQAKAALRRVRETARWRQLSGQSIELWQDDNFGWTVILDDAAPFTVSPGFRTVHVSAFRDAFDLERRLEAIRGKIEGFIIASHPSDDDRDVASGLDVTPASAAIRALAVRCGATYICAPGESQSPPLSWPHGGGDFIRMLSE